MERFLTVKEVSERLKIAEHTIYTLARNGKIPSAKIGGSVRFDWAEIERYLRSKNEGEDSK